jgi:hypothetical protein
MNSAEQRRGQQAGSVETVNTPALSNFVRCKIKEANLSIDELRRIFRYDDATGLLYWKINVGNKIRIGSTAGTIGANGYRVIRYKGRAYRAHRITWALNTGEWPDNEIDHSKRETDNNNFYYLGEATRSQNSQNQSLRRNNTSSCKGVCWHKHNGKWLAQASIKGRLKYLGYFTDKSAAALAVDIANLSEHGEFAVLNDETATIRALFGPPPSTAIIDEAV